MSDSIFPVILVRVAGLPPLSLAGPWPDEKAQKAAAEHLQQAFDAALPTLPDSPFRTALYNARKRFFQHQKVPSPTFEQLLLSHQTTGEIAHLLDSLQIWEKTQLENQLARTAVETALLQNWRSIQQAAEQPTFRQALLFASHDLLARLPVFCTKPPEQFTAKDRQTGLAVLQYLNRAAHKTSPLSRFTTVALWRWEQDVATIDPEEPDFLQGPKAVITPNVALLPLLYEVLLQEPAFYQSLRLSLNPCITALSAAWQKKGLQEETLNWLYFSGEQESFQQVAYHPTVAAVVEICLVHQRHITWPMLLDQLQIIVEGDKSDLQAFVLELIALGLLAWEWPERGLNAGWCAGLYNYLGHLPTKPTITSAAALLQWLRTAARTLPFQSMAGVQEIQAQTLRQVQAFLEASGSTAPPIPPEQIFLEDVEQSATIHVPPEVVRQLTQQLADCWQQSGPHQLPPFRSALFAFAASELAVGESRAFLPFCQQFLAEKANWERLLPAEGPPWPGKMGALLQIFQQENGQYGAVVNALFPGGGKLLARWLHLFPSEIREQMQVWFPSSTLAYPWQDWSNANFQPPLGHIMLAVPDGRVVGKPGSRAILLGDLAVQRMADGPRLIDRHTGDPVWMTDLGLESPTTRPPVMQVLWQLGMPFVSLDGLRPRRSNPLPTEQSTSHFRPRLEHQSLVLLRAAWHFPSTIWQLWRSTSSRATERLWVLHQALLKNDIPRHFFARFQAEKPQYFDRDSPVCLLLLDKMLRHGAGSLYCTEMLPTPEQAVVEQGREWRTAEFVVEWEG